MNVDYIMILELGGRDLFQGIMKSVALRGKKLLWISFETTVDLDEHVSVGETTL
jgi:hypothetical protein